MRLDTVILGSMLAGCTTEGQLEKPGNSETGPRIHNTADLSNFDTDHILVYTACDMLDDYGRELKKRGRSYKGFSLRDSGDTWEGQYKGRDILVACNPEDLSEDYEIVNLRGHGSDMPHFYNNVKDHFADYTTLVLGGCDSSSMVDTYRNEHVAFIGGSGVQDTDNNNYLILQLPKQIDEAGTWESLGRNMKKKSVRFHDFVSPATYNQ